MSMLERHHPQGAYGIAFPESFRARVDLLVPARRKDLLPVFGAVIESTREGADPVSQGQVLGRLELKLTGD